MISKPSLSFPEVVHKPVLPVTSSSRKRVCVEFPSDFCSEVQHNESSSNVLDKLYFSTCQDRHKGMPIADIFRESSFVAL